MYKVIPDEDYEQAIIPRFSRIFDNEILNWFDQPFINPSWEAVLIPDDIWLGRAVSDGDDVYKYIKSAIKIYKALIAVIELRGASHIFTAITPFTDPVKVTCNRQDFGAIVDTKNFIEELSEMNRKEKKFWPYFALCDETETWGYANHMDHFSFLGGTPEFMESFFALCGGREIVRQTFHEYDICTSFPYSFEDGEFPVWEHSGNDPNVPRTETVREFIYRSVGWEAPPYTEEEIRNHFYDPERD